MKKILFILLVLSSCTSTYYSTDITPYKLDFEPDMSWTQSTPSTRVYDSSYADMERAKQLAIYRRIIKEDSIKKANYKPDTSKVNTNLMFQKPTNNYGDPSFVGSSADPLRYIRNSSIGVPSINTQRIYIQSGSVFNPSNTQSYDVRIIK